MKVYSGGWILSGASVGAKYALAIATFFAGYVVQFGGMAAEGAAGGTWLWDWTKDAWVAGDASTNPSPRFGHVMANSGDTLVLFGGAAPLGPGLRYLNDTWTYSAPRGWSRMR